jgi:phage minor structural protein
LITIYDSRETDFSHNGLCVLDPIVKSCTLTEVLNAEFSIDIELFKDKDNKYKYLKDFCIIKAKGQLFRLYNISNVQDRGITIRATLHHISNDINTDYLDYIELVDSTINNTLQSVVLDDRFTILSSDITAVNTITIDSDKPLKCLIETVVPAYKGELKRDNFKIGVLSRLGVDTGIVIEYSKNITGFEQTLDYSELVTKMKPIGKDDITIDIVNSGSEWITSPRVNNYFKVFTSPMDFKNIEDATELKTAGEALWGTIDLPKANYKVNFVELKNTVEYKDIYKNIGSLELGDSVIIRHNVFEVNLTARVIKITKDAYTGKTLEIELGEFRDNLFNTLDRTDYKISAVNTSLEASKKDLYTRVAQNDERITLEAVRLDGDISDTRAAIDISADNIRLETSKSITDVNGRVDRAVADISVNATNIGLKVQKGTVIGEINVSPEAVKIAAQKLELSGYATFYSLQTRGATVIDGGNIMANTISFNNLYDKPLIPSQYTNDMALSAIRGTYIDSNGVWTSAVYADNIRAGTLKSVNLESSNLKMTGGNIILEPEVKYYSSGSQVPLTFNTYANMSIESTGVLKYWAGSFWFDKSVTAANVFTSGAMSCNSLTVNGTNITGNAVVAKFG